MRTPKQDQMVNRQATQTDRDDQKALRKLVSSKFEQAFESIKQVLPGHVDAARFVKVALASVSRDKKLLTSTTDSLLLALMRSAELGLEPGAHMGECYFVAYWNGRINANEAVLIPGYRGLQKLARQSTLVAGFSTELVFEHDYFEYLRGTEERIVHKPKLLTEERGEMLGGYCIVTMRAAADPPILLWMDRTAINRIRDRALERKKDKDGSPWSTDYEEMCIKTLVRRACKRTPSSSQDGLFKALQLQYAAERGEPLERSEVQGLFKNAIDTSMDSAFEDVVDEPAATVPDAPSAPPVKKSEPAPQPAATTPAAAPKPSAKPAPAPVAPPSVDRADDHPTAAVPVLCGWQLRGGLLCKLPRNHSGACQAGDTPAVEPPPMIAEDAAKGPVSSPVETVDVPTWVTEMREHAMSDEASKKSLSDIGSKILREGRAKQAEVKRVYDECVVLLEGGAS